MIICDHIKNHFCSGALIIYLVSVREAAIVDRPTNNVSLMMYAKLIFMPVDYYYTTQTSNQLFQT